MDTNQISDGFAKMPKNSAITHQDLSNNQLSAKLYVYLTAQRGETGRLLQVFGGIQRTVSYKF